MLLTLARCPLGGLKRLHYSQRPACGALTERLQHNEENQ
jgi:hypothetical protein